MNSKLHHDIKQENELQNLRYYINILWECTGGRYPASGFLQTLPDT